MIHYVTVFTVVVALNPQPEPPGVVRWPSWIPWIFWNKWNSQRASVELNPQPLPPGNTRIGQVAVPRISAAAIQPQPLPPAKLRILTAHLNSQPEAPAMVEPSLCYTKKCPPPSYCELQTPPCGKIPVPTCICPKGQIWSDYPNCTVSCADTVIERDCPECQSPRCICPAGQLFDFSGKCTPRKKCPPLRG